MLRKLLESLLRRSIFGLCCASSSVSCSVTCLGLGFSASIIACFIYFCFSSLSIISVSLSDLFILIVLPCLFLALFGPTPFTLLPSCSFALSSYLTVSLRVCLSFRPFPLIQIWVNEGHRKWISPSFSPPLPPGSFHTAPSSISRCPSSVLPSLSFSPRAASVSLLLPYSLSFHSLHSPLALYQPLLLTLQQPHSHALSLLNFTPCPSPNTLPNLHPLAHTFAFPPSLPSLTPFPLPSPTPSSPFPYPAAPPFPYPFPFPTPPFPLPSPHPSPHPFPSPPLSSHPRTFFDIQGQAMKIQQERRNSRPFHFVLVHLMSRRLKAVPPCFYFVCLFDCFFSFIFFFSLVGYACLLFFKVWFLYIWIVLILFFCKVSPFFHVFSCVSVIWSVCEWCVWAPQKYHFGFVA